MSLALCTLAMFVGCLSRATEQEGMEGITFRLLNETEDSKDEIQKLRVPGQHSVDGFLFQFRNDTLHTIELPILGLPVQQEILQPGTCHYEAMTAGSWRFISGPSCGDAELYPVKPNDEVRLLVYLDIFKRLGTADAAIVRIGLGKFSSDPFVLGLARYRNAEKDKVSE